MKYFFAALILLAIVVASATSIYYSHKHISSTRVWIPNQRRGLHPGANKADVRKFCEFLTLSRFSFDTYRKQGTDIEAEVTVDDVKYKFIYKPSIYMFDMTITDGGEELSIKDISADGTVDSSTRSKYNYLGSRYVPEEPPKTETQFNEQMDYANSNYEKYLTQLMRYFKIHLAGELNI